MPRKQDQSNGMVDVGGKKVTLRTAVACACVRMKKRTYQALVGGESPKGDVFQTARVAAIMAAKETPRIVPLCHPLELSKVEVRFERDPENAAVRVLTEVRARSRTGVEMEALTACCAAALTVYDMMKWKDKAIEITQVALLKKTGGKSGDYRRSAAH